MPGIQSRRCWPVRAAFTADSGTGPPRSSSGCASSAGGRTSIPTFPIPAASESSPRRSTAQNWSISMTGGAGAHRVDYTARLRCGMKYSPIARPPVTAVARSSLCCTLMDLRCTGCSAMPPASPVEVTKLTAVTAAAHIAVWRVLLGLDLMDTITVDTHPADPLPYLLTDARRVQTTSSEDALWLRIIDIPATLEARSYQADLSAVLEISDDALGGGTFTLTIHNGKARVAPTKDTPDLHTDLSVLGSIYMGAHRASAFATANRLRCNDNDLLRQLDVAFATEVSAELGYGF